MKIDVSPYRVEKRGAVRLKDWPTRVDPPLADKADMARALADHVEQLAALQDRLYAAGRDSLLVLFQAMDAAGKDGAIKHVMSGVNPQGCQVTSFKRPGPVELQHDFLWRYHVAAPDRGRIGIFNRSHYEEVLVVRVHPELLFAEERADPKADAERIFAGRYKSIRHFERHLTRNGVTLVKIFLHLSREEQRRRFLARIEDPEKSWKFSLADMQERGFWDAYADAYEAAIAETSEAHAPWWVVPADHKPTARLIVSQIILDAMADLDLRPPPESPERRAALKALRETLEKED